MRTAFRKNIFRTIKKSLGRYMAIFAIIALGVGFFSGLKSSKPAMMRTGQEYLEEQSFFDYRLISTWGFDETEIEALNSLDGVRAAEGAVWEDFIYVNENGVENCLKALSVTGDVNKLTVESGRLPKKGNECVLDAAVYSEDMIGKELVISDENSRETKDSFAYDSYTVTGLVRTPLYLNMERGTTTIGNGKITAFVFLPLSGFSYDYYEEVYVEADIAKAAFTEAYEEMIEARTDSLETESIAIVEDRYRTEIANARKEIADGEKELAQEEADARQELDDAKTELEEAEEELADGRAELRKGKSTLEDKKQELFDGEKALSEGEKALTEAEEAFKAGEAELITGETAFAEGEAKLIAGEQAFADGEAKLIASEQAFAEGEAGLLEGEARYQQERKNYEENLKDYELGKNELEANRAAYEEAKAGIKQMEAMFPEEELLTNEAYLMLLEKTGEFETMEQELAGVKQQLDTAGSILENTLARLTASRKELEANRAVLEGSRKELEANRAVLEASRKELEANRAVLKTSREELEENRTLLAENRRKLTDSRAQIEEGKGQLQEAENELAKAEQEILDGEQKLLEGWNEYQDGLQELETELTDARKELSDAKEELADLEEPDVYVLDRGTNVGYASYEGDVSIVDGVAKIFPAFFFLIAALVCSTTMTRMVDDERTQIGTLRALGYTKSAILSKYMIYSGSAAFLGACVGYYFGSRMFPAAIWTAYGMLYGFADLIMADNFLLFLFSLLVSLLCSVGTTFLSCRMELIHAPAELIRPKAPVAGKRILLEKITFFWRRLKFLHKVSARNVFRFKKRMFMMIIGIAGCMALVMAGFGVNDSVSNIVNDQYDNILKYDISATYTKSVTEEALKEIEDQFGESIASQTVLMETSVEAPYEGGVKTVTLMVSEDEAIRQCVDFHLKGKTAELPGKGEILIDKRLAEVFQAEIGDEIVLRIGEIETKPLTVAGIFENYTFYYAYVTAETYEAYFGEAFEPKTIYMALNEETDHYQVASYLSDMKSASNISVIADMRERVSNTMESMNYIVALIILCAAALAFIVLFNLGNINISERIREIATLKVLGFYPREAGAYVFRESMVLSVMGIVVGIPLGILLHRFVILQIKIDMVSPDIKILPLSYLYSVLLVLAFTVCVDLIMRRKINHINMAESLKSIE